MTKFSVFFKNVCIGTTSFEFGDPPMGVAFGKLVTCEAYTQSMASPEFAEFLSVLSQDGFSLNGTGGIAITDLTYEMGPEGIEITVLGIACSEYEKLFPLHVAAYERQFKNGC